MDIGAQAIPGRKEIMCPALDTLRVALLTALRPTGATRIFDTAGSAPLPLSLDRVSLRT